MLMESRKARNKEVVRAEVKREFIVPIDYIGDIPPDNEEIVRCKDCRYGQYCTDGETMYQCFKWNSGEFGVLHEQDWFCADGTR